MSSYELHKVIGECSYIKLKNAATKENRSVNQYIKLILKSKYGMGMKQFKVKDVTFSNSKNVPFQRWYPYIEGYSPSFVKDIINIYCKNPKLIYEPFAGTGTTLLASDQLGFNTVYSEVNPLLRFLIEAKITVMSMQKDERILLSERLLACSQNIISKSKKLKPSKDLSENYKTIFGESVYFNNEQFEIILKLRKFIDLEYKKGEKIFADLLSVAVFSCLLSVSYLKKQGDVRFKTEAEKIKEIRYMEVELPQKLKIIAEDVANCDYSISQSHKLVIDNAKNIGSAPKQEISDVITSPPYLNGTNYFRNTKLELWFLRFIKSEKDLRHYRDSALTSGINDVKKEYSTNKTNFKSKLLDKTLAELEIKAYDKRIPLMAKCYFQEMYQLFNGLKIHLKNESNILIDLGDSIFSGVHIRTDYILIDVLQELGYSFKERVILRERRSRNGELLSQVLLSFKYNTNEL